MASDNAHAIDLILCKMWGIDPEKVYTLQAAKNMGLLPDIKDIEIKGGTIDDFKASPKWKPANPAGIEQIAGPAWMTPVWEKLLEAKPLVHHEQCTMCLECFRHCPAEAMDPKTGRILIDKNKCISCFVCQEICPQGAISVHTGLLARMLRLKSQ